MNYLKKVKMKNRKKIILNFRKKWDKLIEEIEIHIIYLKILIMEKSK